MPGQSVNNSFTKKELKYGQLVVSSVRLEPRQIDLHSLWYFHC